MLLEKMKPLERAQPNVPDDLKGTRAGLFYLLASRRESEPQNNRSQMRPSAPQPATYSAKQQDPQIFLEDDNFLFKTR